MGPALNGCEVTGVDCALHAALRDLEPGGSRTANRTCKSQLALFTAERHRALRPAVAFLETCLKQMSV